MPKLSEVVDEGGRKNYYFDCPGCKERHSVITCPIGSDDVGCWQFNGDVEAPTVRPGIMSRIPASDDSEASICHVFVTDGRLYFWHDCTHELRGLSIEMEEINWQK